MVGVGWEMDMWHARKVEEVGSGGGDDEDCGDVWDLAPLE